MIITKNVYIDFLRIPAKEFGKFGRRLVVQFWRLQIMITWK